MKLARKQMRVCAKWVVKSAIFKIESHPASREEPWIEPFFICLLAWLERKNERLWSLNSYMKVWNDKNSDERFRLKRENDCLGTVFLRDWKLHHTYRVAMNRLKPKHERALLSFDPNLSTGKTAQQRQWDTIPIFCTAKQFSIIVVFISQ